MPFKSKAQQGFMFSEHPEMAKEWAAKTPNMKELPEHVRKMALGGLAGGSPADEPGIQDATVSDFLGPLLGAPKMAEAADAIPAISDALGEAGEISIGKAAPKMEEAAAEGAPKVEAYIKGIQKGYKGSPDIKIWSVKGDPSEISKLGFGPEPGSIPEGVLRQHGILPEEIDMTGNNAPNSYAEGGDVQFPAGGYPGAGTDNLQAIIQMLKTGGMGAMLPGGIGTNAIAQGSANAANNASIPDLTAALKAGIGDNSAPPPPTAPAVDQAFINQMNTAPNGGMQTPPPAPAPQGPPSLTQAAQTAQNAPSTSPDIYAGIGAPDRAALAQQLLAQKASPGNMIASGVGGLGDAITSAFGKSPTNFQGNIRNAQAQNAQQRLGVVDTERQQKLQDIQAKISVQESDPNSPFSQGMRQFLQAQGMKVPSGMSAAMLKNTLPDVSKIFESKLLALTQQGAQGVEAGKALMGETLWQQIKDSLGLGGEAPAGENYLASRIGASGQSSAPAANTGGWKVVR